MSDDGKKILSGIKQLSDFFEQCQLLLRTVDDQMNNEGWIDDKDNLVTAYVSKSIKDHRQWFPHFLFRYYTHKKMKNLLLFVSILLDDDIDGEYRTKLVEPFMTAGFLDYGHEKTVNEDYHKWTAKMYGYEGDLSKAESINSSERKEEEEDKDSGYGCESYGCFGFPLVELHNPDDIAKKVVRPLIELPSSQATKKAVQ